MPASVIYSILYNLLVSCQTFLLQGLITTDITTIPFIFIMKGSFMNLHDFRRCDLKIAYVTGKRVNLINAVERLIICEIRLKNKSNHKDISYRSYSLGTSGFLFQKQLCVIYCHKSNLTSSKSQFQLGFIQIQAGAELCQAQGKLKLVWL